MTSATVIDETAANLRARPLGTLIQAAVSVVVLITTVLIVFADVSAVAHRKDELVQRGATTFTVSRTDGTPLSAGSCEALNGRDGVVAAGGRVATVRAALGVETGLRADIDVVYGTSHYPLVQWPRLQKAGPPLGSPLLDRSAALGFDGAESAPLVDASGGAGSAAVVELGPSRQPIFSRHMFVPRLAAGVAECIVQYSEGSAEAVEALIVSMLEADGSIDVVPLYVPDPVASEAASFDSRRTEWAPVLSGCVLALLGLGGALLRRQDHAVYMLYRVRGPRLALLALTEFALIVAVPSAIGATVGLAIVLHSPDVSASLLHLVGLSLIPPFAVALLAPLLWWLVLERAGVVDSLSA